MGRPTKDLSGQRFYKLVAIERDYKPNCKDAIWVCKCDCGNKTTATSHDLRYGKKKSCGCSTNEDISKAKQKDVCGMRFGRLVAIERVGMNRHSQSIWKCKCDCGNYTNVTIGQLTSGATQSCGCWHRETFTRTSHNESNTPLYKIWCAMKDRCSRPRSTSYKWYGAKGITVCDEWGSDYETFRDWAMANGYIKGLSIDRINSDLGYSPENCRWLTRAENARRAAKEMQRRRKNV